MDDFLEEQVENRLWREDLDELLDEQTREAGGDELES